MKERLHSLISRSRNSVVVRRFLGGAAWSVVGSVASSGLTLLAVIIVARFLGRETYGKFVIIQTTLSMAGIFAGLGVGTTATRYVAELRSSNPARLSRILALSERAVSGFSILAAIALAASSRMIASGALNEPAISLPLAIASFSVLFSALDNYQKCVLIGLERMRVFAIATTAGAVVNVPVLLIGAKMYGLNGAAAAMVITALVQFTISRILVSLQLKQFGIRESGTGCFAEWRVLRDFALPALLGGILVGPAHWVCQAMLANTSGSYSQVAVIGIAMQWLNVIMFLPSVAGRVLLPMLTEHMVTGSHNKTNRLLQLATGANIAVAAPVALLIAICSPWIVLAYGPQFHGAALPLAIAALTSILVVGAMPVGQVLAAANRMWLGAIMNTGWAVLYLGSAVLLVRYGATGIAVSLAIAYLGHTTWTTWYVLHRLSGANETATDGSSCQARG